MKKYFILITVLSLFAVSCSNVSNTTKKATSQTQSNVTKEVKNTSWNLIAISDETLNLKDNTKITLNFDNDKIYGHSAINNYFTEYTLKGNNIKFEAIGATLMGGPQELMDLESKYLTLLGNATSFHFDENDNLILISGNDKLIFSRVK